MYDFQKSETIRSFGDSIYAGKINMDETEMNQTNRLENMIKVKNKSKPNTIEGKDKKRNTFDSVNALYEGRELTLNAFKSGIFPLKATKSEGRPSMLASRAFDLVRVTRVAKLSDRNVFDRTRLKILTSKQMCQRLPIGKYKKVIQK